ncbi:hypothetical protein T02_14435 [Trichinella nativa]|uniref:Uncharacterized protein n=1 Tax=Trichinella nativa TaxID=6335 RepID=A0A0V1KKF4_9BILA|nr:hypothetical protein T02_14435 [Trichinella nativa]
MVMSTIVEVLSIFKMRHKNDEENVGDIDQWSSRNKDSKLYVASLCRIQTDFIAVRSRDDVCKIIGHLEVVLQ